MHERLACSPVLPPCDFFLVGLGRWAKDEMHRGKPRNLDELEDRVRDVVGNVPNQC